MFKKLVALVCVVVLCLAMVSEALASGNSGCNHTWEWQYGGKSYDRMMKVSDEYHRNHLYFVKICNQCGTMGGSTYIVDEASSYIVHRYTGTTYDYHQGLTHYFYKVCDVCYGRYNETPKACPGGDAHVRCPF